MSDVIMIIGEIDGWTIEAISSSIENGPCVLDMVHSGMNVRKDGDYPSIKAASSDLRCNFGLGPVIELLESNKVPHDSEWWHLNHDNPWK